jgi:hypothetical protein
MFQVLNINSNEGAKINVRVCLKNFKFKLTISLNLFFFFADYLTYAAELWRSSQFLSEARGRVFG